MAQRVYERNWQPLVPHGDIKPLTEDAERLLFLTITSADVGMLFDFDCRLRHLVAATDACLLHLRQTAGTE